MPWRDILVGGGYNAALHTLREGGGFSDVYRVLRSHFPDELPNDIREAARRTLDSFNTAQQLNRARRERAVPISEIPGLTGSRRTSISPEDCTVRYGLTVQIHNDASDQSVWRRLPVVDADASLSVSELRGLAEQVASDYFASARGSDRNRFAPGDLSVTAMRVDFIWAC